MKLKSSLKIAEKIIIFVLIDKWNDVFVVIELGSVCAMYFTTSVAQMFVQKAESIASPKLQLQHTICMIVNKP